MNATATPWSEADFCTALSADGTADLLPTVYDRVCRTDWRTPGFCLIDLGPNSTSQVLRRTMAALKQGLQHLHRLRTGRDLVLLSAGRFDQQVTTKAHRDGGPDESLLLLGYEPSQVRSELWMSDYSRCAHDMGLTPAEFLEKHNPMFVAGEPLLRDYTTRVACFCHRSHQVVVINNSIAPFSAADPAWQGVLHTARIHNPDEAFRRVVNSFMVASVPLGTPEPVSAEEQREFLLTTKVRRRGYDKPELPDDA